MRLPTDTVSVKFAAAGPAQPVLDYETRAPEVAENEVALDLYRVRPVGLSGLTVNAHPKQPHVRIENGHTWLMCKSASGTWPTPLSLRTFWFGTVWWRPEVGNFLPSSR